jgi:hypothetical protein
MSWRYASLNASDPVFHREETGGASGRERSPGRSKTAEPLPHDLRFFPVTIDAAHLEDEDIAIDLEVEVVGDPVVIGVFFPLALLPVHGGAVFEVLDPIAVLGLDIEIEDGKPALGSFVDVVDLAGRFVRGFDFDHGDEGEEKAEGGDEAHDGIGMETNGDGEV